MAIDYRSFSLEANSKSLNENHPISLNSANNMNGKFSQALIVLALIVVMVATIGEAHKKFYSAPQYEPERCQCDCGGHHQQPVLPNRPYYGSGGYAQQPPRPSGGYGNAGSYAVAGSYGSGGSQVSGGY